MTSLPAASRGVTLIELLVALALATSIIAGLAYAVARAREAHRTNDAAARLQEQARYGLALIGPDIELAAHLGFARAESPAMLVRGGDAAAVLASGDSLRQPADASAAAPAGTPTPLHACGINFALDLSAPVEGSDGEFRLGTASTAACTARGGGPGPGTDTLTLRRASTDTARPEKGRLQLYSARLDRTGTAMLFFDGQAPGPIDVDHDVRNVVVRTYYVSRDSVGQPGLPALRVKTLTSVSGTPGYTDTEVLQGVEDFQVEFGIDTRDYDADGAIDLDPADGRPVVSRAQVTRYVPPRSPALAGAQVVAVRVWLRLRADRDEPGFVDGRTYRYADVDFEPAGAAKRVRRLLVSRTFSVRNARRT